MAFFSRLTDIVTCNLNEIIARADDPLAALDDVIREMEEGLAGARRSVATAQANSDRIEQELNDGAGDLPLGAAVAELGIGREEVGVVVTGGEDRLGTGLDRADGEVLADVGRVVAAVVT